MTEGKKGLENIVGMLCTDIAGTLLHLTGEMDDNLKEVDKQGRKIHAGTPELLQQIHESGVIVTLVTGMRESSYNSVREHIPHDYCIIEHGGIILKDGVADQEWYSFLSPEIGAVQVYKRVVQSKLPVDDANRTTSFRIVPDADEGLNIAAIATILKSVQGFIPENELELKQIVIERVVYSIPVMRGVKLFLHEPKPPEYACVEFVPEKSGKSNAIEFLAGRYKMGWEKIGAFGDDANDIEMLAKAGWGMTFGSSSDSVRHAISHANASFTTSYSKHRGTNDVLEYFIREVIPVLKGS